MSIKKGDTVKILHTDYTAKNLQVGCIVKVENVFYDGNVIELIGEYDDGSDPQRVTFFKEEVEKV
jgi:hypothetical protein